METEEALQEQSIAPSSPSPLVPLFEAQRRMHLLQGGLSVPRRKEALASLAQALSSRQDALLQALEADLGKSPAIESLLAEVILLAQEARTARKSLRGWMRPQKVKTRFWSLGARARVFWEPKGVVGIWGGQIWPVYQTLSPLISALAAGNRVMALPSPLAPRTAEAMKALVQACLDPEEVLIVDGKNHGEAFARLPFDFLFAMDADQKAQDALRLALANLTPLAWFSGGKSPALVLPGYPLQRAADRIVTGKCFLAGQSPWAVDHVWVPREEEEAFANAVMDVLLHRYSSLRESPDFARIFSEGRHKKISALLADAARKGARIWQANPQKEEFIEKDRLVPPTLVLQVREGMRLLKEEILGPVLPICTYANVDEALSFLRRLPPMPALYVFGTRKKDIAQVLRSVPAASVSVNRVFSQVFDERLPLSGTAAWRAQAGFEAFSKPKAVLFPGWGSLFSFIKPPYSRRLMKFLSWRIRRF